MCSVRSTAGQREPNAPHLAGLACPVVCSRPYGRARPLRTARRGPWPRCAHVTPARERERARGMGSRTMARRPVPHAGGCAERTGGAGVGMGGGGGERWRSVIWPCAMAIDARAAGRSSMSNIWRGLARRSAAAGATSACMWSTAICPPGRRTTPEPSGPRPIRMNGPTAACIPRSTSPCRGSTRADPTDPTRGGAAKDPAWNHREKVLALRVAWAETANRALAQAGLEVRIDHRSLAAQGIDRTPEPKLGPEQTALLRQGIVTPQAAEVLELRQDRAPLARVEQEVARLQARRRDRGGGERA